MPPQSEVTCAARGSNLVPDVDSPPRDAARATAPRSGSHHPARCACHPSSSRRGDSFSPASHEAGCTPGRCLGQDPAPGRCGVGVRTLSRFSVDTKSPETLRTRISKRPPSCLQDTAAPMLTTLAISNYRSLRDLILPLQGLNVLTGRERQRQVQRLSRAASAGRYGAGRVIPSLAREGGLPSTLWAGPETHSRAVKRGDYPVQGTVRKHSVSLRLGFAGEEFGYAIDLGLPTPTNSAFALDPEIKRECIWSGPLLRPATLLVDRRGPLVRTRTDGRRVEHADPAPGELRQHDGAACRSPERAGDADAQGADPRLALLRSFPHRPRGAGPLAASRHAHARARSRRCGPGCGAADHPRDRRRRGAGRRDRRRVFRARVSRSPAPTGGSKPR